MDDFSIRSLGDSAVTIDLADDMGDAATERVAVAGAVLRRAVADGSVPGLVEVVRAMRSITVHYDPALTRRAEIEPAVTHLLREARGDTQAAGRHWRLPASYAPEHAPDLEEAARRLDLSPQEIIERHAAGRYRVYMIGFLPGFPFMGDLPESLHLPRRSEPRTRVPAGSVAVAGRLTAVYPWESPGGWTLLGYCPVPLFSTAWPRPALLTAADTVSFEPVTAAEAESLARDFAAGRRDPHDLAEDAS